MLTTKLGKVCKNAEIEPHLQPLDNERFDQRSAVTSPEARLNMKADGFLLRRAAAFFDVGVTHVNSKCNQRCPTHTIFKGHENKKKRKYQQRVLNVEMGSFTPLIFRTNGGMGSEWKIFSYTVGAETGRKR